MSIGDCVLRGSPEDFRQREITMKMDICSKKAQFVSKGLVFVAEFHQANPHCSAIVFCNSRKQSQHFSKELEKKLDHMRLSVDVININGSLDKIDKFWRIRLFCDNRHTRHGQFRVLVTTNASNVGIDKNSVALQVRFELPRDLPTYFQEQGRGSRCPGEPSTCILYGDLGSYVYLRIQLFAVGNDVEDDVTSSTPGGNGYNSAISPWKQGQASPKKKNYPLSIMARRTLCLRTQTKFHEVIRYFCLDLGCQQARGEFYLSTGALPQARMDYEVCNNSCPICTKCWHELFIPVYLMSVVSFLEFLMLTGKLPAEVDYTTPVSSVLAASAFWKETIFDRNFHKVTRNYVDAFFLLAAAGILKLEPKKDSLFQWVVAREHGESITAVSFIEANIGTPLYKRDDLWNGINVISEARLRKRDPSLLNNI
jgi:hypothetical protein